MNKNDEFVKPTNDQNFDIFDKEMEEEFSFEDILIKENGLDKIYIKESSYKVINKDNNINKNINNMNNNMNNFNNNKNNNINKNMNNMINNINNFNNMNNLNNINNMNKANIIKNNINNNINMNMINNNMNNINNNMNMNNINIMNNNMNMNMNNINPFNNMFNNMINMNNNISNLSNMNFNINNNMNMNNINPFNNNMFNNMVNMNNNISNMNNMNFNMNNMINNINNQNNMSNNNYFMIKYNVNFKTSNGIKSSLIVNGSAKMVKLLKKFERKMDAYKYLGFIYNGQKIEFNPSLCIIDFFKDEKNPTILVEDKENLIGKLINVIFKIKNGDEYVISFNSKSKINDIKYNFFYELFGPNYYNDQIKFLYKNHEIKSYDKSKIENINHLFKKDDNPKIIIDDPNNVIGKKLKVTFKINNADSQEIITHTKDIIGNLIRKFLNEIDGNFNLYPTFIYDPYDNWSCSKKFLSNVQFLYNGKEIYWFNDNQQGNEIIYNSISIENYFKHDNNPEIIIMDKNNYLNPININVTFQTNYGNCFNVHIRDIKTIDHLLTQYLYEMEHFELVDTNKIAFLYYNMQLNFRDNTILREVFINDKNPLILVVDANYLLNNKLNNKLNIIFKLNTGRNDAIHANYGTTVDQVLKQYLYKICEEESIDSYYSKINYLRFQFLYCASNIKGKQINVERFFNGPSPYIIVISG